MAYLAIQTILLCILPVIAIVVCYTCIFWKMCRRQTGRNMLWLQQMAEWEQLISLSCMSAARGQSGPNFEFLIDFKGLYIVREQMFLHVLRCEQRWFTYWLFWHFSSVGLLPSSQNCGMLTFYIDFSSTAFLCVFLLCMNKSLTIVKTAISANLSVGCGSTQRLHWRSIQKFGRYYFCLKAQVRASTPWFLAFCNCRETSFAKFQWISRNRWQLVPIP